MRRWFLRKFVWLAAVLFLTTAGAQVFVALLPGDPAVVIAGMSGSQAAVDATRRQLGLDRPLPERYVDWVGKVARGDLGQSRRFSAPVSDLLRQRFGRSVQVLIGAQIIAIGTALVLGTWAGWRAGGRLDRIVSAGAFTALAVPPFAMGAVLILLFGVRLRWLPPLGYESVIGSPLQGLRHLLLPCLTLGLPIGAIYTRTLRSDVAAAAGQDHVVLARANGLSTRRILTRHVLRQCSLGMLTQIGLNLPWMFSFLVVVERLFNLFGAGELVQEAVANREFLVLQTTILVFAAIYVVVTLALDALHHVADPRLRRVPVDS